MNPKMLLPIFKKAYAGWNKDEAPRLGAALAFYTILSLSPLLIFVVALIGLIMDRSAAQADILGQVQGMIGPQGSKAVETVLSSAQKPSSGIVGTIIGIVTLLFGASGVFGELRSALNKIWEVKPKDDAGFIGIVRDRFFSFGMVLSIGFLLMVSLILSAGLAATEKFFGGLLPAPAAILAIVNFLVSFVAIAALFGLIFKFVPETRISWRDVRTGALVTALLFTMGKTLIGLYLGKASVGSAYGSAGSIIVIIVWVYYSAQIFLFGAEFTHAYAQAHEPSSVMAHPAGTLPE